MLKRLPDWPQRLSAAAREHRNTAHAYGSFDCILAGCTLVDAMTGTDLGAPFRGTYSDEDGAKAKLAELGHPDLASLSDAYLPRCEGRWRRGDWLILPGKFGAYVGIAWDRGALAADVTGLRWRPTTGIIGSWRVG